LLLISTRSCHFQRTDIYRDLHTLSNIKERTKSKQTTDIYIIIARVIFIAQKIIVASGVSKERKVSSDVFSRFIFLMVHTLYWCK
jgi:hypothetical protein